jgi:putative hemolysin
MSCARLVCITLAAGAVACSTEAPPPQFANPASEHCVQQGGKHVAEKRPDGAAFGVRQFEDNRQCEEWALLRGQCPSGGLRITGYVTAAGRYCAITGGRYTVTSGSDAASETGTCALPGGVICDADAFYRGTCDASSGRAATTPPADLAGSWLDRQLVNWNVAREDLHEAPPAEEPREKVVGRCRLTPPRSTASERAVASAGWIPFLPGGKPLVQNDVEIVGGMAGADGMCRPVTYNLFVFVAGRFAGTLSPTVMTSRLDGSAGTVELTTDRIDAEFSRYRESDPLCCPSSRVSVRYRIDRSPAPVIVPMMATPVAIPAQ